MALKGVSLFCCAKFRFDKDTGKINDKNDVLYLFRRKMGIMETPHV